ncbi:MarR family winged helix-turn-helix transcriptional regulator [Proteinivorax hydrogeniformans]|uniref:MarR family winged helix-turn-helix transcriptional regulator n=1 Tax=Proteinivorax hydrogeniformans TaxID=1826727 RepID=A0AAU8HVI8_9FIRM
MSKSVSVLNELLVELFNDILSIEQNAIKTGDFSDLSITEMHTIEAIGKEKQRTMSEVATDLKITIGTLSIAINSLVRKGYVEKVRSEKDRRIVYVTLNKKGKLAFRIHEKFHNEMVQQTISGLSEEEEEVLIKALEKLNRFFKESNQIGEKGE